MAQIALEEVMAACGVGSQCEYSLKSEHENGKRFILLQIYQRSD